MGWIEGTESISIYHFKFFRENCVIENFVWKKINKKIFPARYFQQWTFISLKSHCVLQNCTQNALNRQYGFRSRPKRLVKVIECSISVVCTLKHMRRFEIEGLWNWRLFGHSFCHLYYNQFQWIWQKLIPFCSIWAVAVKKCEWDSWREYNLHFISH